MQASSERLRLITTHMSSLSAGAAAAPATRTRDMYSNTWSIDPEGRLSVQPGGRAAPQPVALPFAAAFTVAADDNGYLWAADRGGSLFRLDPRGPHYAAEEGGPPSKGGGLFQSQDTGAHQIWRKFDPAVLPEGRITALEGSNTKNCCVVHMSSGVYVEVWMDSAFRSHAQPVAPSPAAPKWASFRRGRLPCGNHDIYAASLNGKIYVSGGQLWYSGYPAQMKEFDEIWELDPTKLSGGETGPAWSIAGQCPDSAWSVVDTRMPAINLDRGEQMVLGGRRAETGPGARCYNGLAALDEELWLVGGCCGTNGTPNNRVPLKSAIVYNPSTGQWREAPSLCWPRAACVASSVHGRIYAFGSQEDGLVESIAAGETAWRIEPAPLPAGVTADAGCVLNGKIYLAGAHGLAAFDPTSQQWGAPTRPPLPAVAAGFSSPAIAAHGGAIWIIGGSGSTEVWSFNPDSDEWAAGPSLPTSLAWGAAWSVITEHCAK